jgi:hypothetical protein
MAAISQEIFEAMKNSKTNRGKFDSPGQIPLGKWIEGGNWRPVDPNKFEQCCERCAQEGVPAKNEDATAAACEHPVKFEGLAYCLHCAWQKNLCRRCGGHLPPPPKKPKPRRHF